MHFDTAFFVLISYLLRRILEIHFQYKNNKSYLQVKHIGLSKILWLDKLVKNHLKKWFDVKMSI